MTKPHSYRRRHYGKNKLYIGIDKEGKDKHVFAYSKKEAIAELRSLGFHPVKVVSH